MLTTRPVFTAEQLRRLANIFDNAGQVLFAGAVLSPLVSGFQNANWRVILSGVIGMIFCWALAIWFERKRK